MVFPFLMTAAADSSQDVSMPRMFKLLKGNFLVNAGPPLNKKDGVVFSLGQLHFSPCTLETSNDVVKFHRINFFNGKMTNDVFTIGIIFKLVDTRKEIFILDPNLREAMSEDRIEFGIPLFNGESGRV